MNGVPNRRYVARTYLSGRPSNAVPENFFDRATRERVEEMTRSLDEQAVVDGAERMLAAEAARLERQEAARGLRRGEPGE